MKSLKISLFILIILFAEINIVKAQQSSELLLSLTKLKTVGSVLYIAAHPDDENTRLLPYLSKERNLRTGYLSLTRGDGGQNLIGKEQGEALGLIRTHELLAARRVDGVEQYFTRANDFGFSKNPEETFAIWNKDSILADVVWVIRQFKPDVIICRFPETGEGGHGHHTASAILALEAFDAAADTKRFPEQLRFVEPWQTKRVFWNTFNFGTTNTTAPDQLKIDVGIYNPLLGKSYGEIASESRSMHKSQGFGTAKTRGSNLEYFKQLKGDKVTVDLFEGIDLSWNRFGIKQKVQDKINSSIEKYDAKNPAKSIPELIALHQLITTLPEVNTQLRFWKKVKLKELEQLIVASSGLWLEVLSPDYLLVPGNEMSLTTQMINRGTAAIQVSNISFMEQFDTVTTYNLKQHELTSFLHKEQMPASINYSNPYRLNEPHSDGLFTVRNKLLIGASENKSPFKVFFDVNINGFKMKLEREVVYKYTDPVKGELYRPIEILPPVTVNISDATIVCADLEPRNVQFVVKSNQPNVKGSLLVKLPEGWVIDIPNVLFEMINKGDEVIVSATLRPSNNAQAGMMEVLANVNQVVYTKSIKRIEYDHIPFQFILEDASAKLVLLELKKTKTNLGYLPGPGDEVPSCLIQIGYDVTILTEELLASENLSKYDAIVTGVRAYNTNNRLQVHYNKLMDYVKNGGNLIVQYNTNSRIGPVLAKIGPYPFTISRDRVTDERATVNFIDTSSIVLNYPNKITAKDFEDWVQERGIYFATDLDKNYKTVFSMNDPKEKASEGSLIMSKYGKGNFVYTGLSFFRELPEGIPGAYRLFVNLLSLPKNE